MQNLEGSASASGSPSIAIAAAAASALAVIIIVFVIWRRRRARAKVPKDVYLDFLDNQESSTEGGLTKQHLELEDIGSPGLRVDEVSPHSSCCSPRMVKDEEQDGAFGMTKTGEEALDRARTAKGSAVKRTPSWGRVSVRSRKPSAVKSRTSTLDTMESIKVEAVSSCVPTDRIIDFVGNEPNYASTTPQASPRAATPPDSSGQSGTPSTSSDEAAGAAEGSATAGLTARLDALSARLSSAKSKDRLPTYKKTVASALVPGVMTRTAPVTGDNPSPPGPPRSDSPVSYDKI